MALLFSRVVLLHAVAIYTLFAFTSIVYSQEPVAFSGNVVNGTSSGQVPANLQVSLRILHSSQEIENRTTEVDEEGSFEFQDVPSDEDSLYGIFTDYQGVRYSLQLDSMPPSTSPELAIYETVTSSEAITLDSDVMIVGWADAEERILGVLESVGVLNSADRTFVSDLEQAGDMNFLRFSLPPSFMNLDVQSTLVGGDVVPVDRGFALTTPIPPGLHELLFTYLVEYDGDSIAIARSFPFGANSFTVLIPEELATLEAPALENMGSTLIGDTQFLNLEGKGFQRDATVNIDIRGLPQPSLLQRAKNALGGGTIATVGIPLVLGLVLAGLLAYVLFLRRSRRVLMAQRLPVEEGRQALIASIARLDDLFERGEITEHQYKERRAALKGRLLQLTGEDAGGGS